MSRSLLRDLEYHLMRIGSVLCGAWFGYALDEQRSWRRLVPEESG